MELEDQEKLLPRGRLIIVFSALAFAMLVTFIDQNSIGVALPTIGVDLHAADTISWAGTSALISNTIFQVLYGRLSDIVGRKIIFLAAVSLLTVGDVLCGLARSGPELYFYRGISGVGNGGITALAMVIVSDTVTLKERGKFQGILGSCVGFGNTIGPFLAAGFIEKASWRALFYCIAPMAFICGIVTFAILPSKRPKDDLRSKVRKIDFLGSISSSAAIILFLIPLSGAGTYFRWNSPMVISMLVLSGLCFGLFILTEWKLAKLPMLPLHLFRIRAVCTIMVQNLLLGIVYYGVLYYLPIYYQAVRQFNPTVTAALTVPVVIGQSLGSVGSGQYISRVERYGEVIWVGYGLWTLGTGLRCLFSRTIPIAPMVFILLIEGVGIGFVFQPTLVAAQAHSLKADRAVVISMRNFMRALGGSVGLALAAAVFSNVLKTKLPRSLSARERGAITASVFRVPDLQNLHEIERDGIVDAYMSASRAVFIMWVPLMAICLCSCTLIRDRGLKRPEEEENVSLAAETPDKAEHNIESRPSRRGHI